MLNVAEKLKDVNFSNGKFLWDKSYAYDTIYFLAKFIRERSQNWIFSRSANVDNLKSYLWLKFSLPSNNPWLLNYYNEAVNVLCYSKTISVIKEWKETFLKILDDDMLEYISTRKMENAYIYLYYLCYFSLKNDNILEFYKKYTEETDAEKRSTRIKLIYDRISQVNVSVWDIDNQRRKQCTEYIFNVMNFINKCYCLTRWLGENSRLWIRNPRSISVNVDWTKTKIKKDNDYLYNFDCKYVEQELNWYLFI